ncbi:thioredoxin family protein [Hydrogenimonas sp.]
MRLLAALLLASLCLAEPVRWQGKFDRALELCRQSGKPMLVLLIKRGCQTCTEAIARINADEKLAALIQKRTVPVLVTKEHEDYPIELLYTLEYPTLFFLTPDERFLAEPMRGVPDLFRLRALLEKEAFDE